MKFIAMGDAHLKYISPKYRTDNIFEVCFEKLLHIYHHAIDNQIDGILWPGDVFDSHRIPYEVVERFINIYNTYTISVPSFIVFGQHDQRYHKLDGKNTPAKCFIEATKNFGNRILSKTPIERIDKGTKEKVHIYGASWGEEIPVIQDKSAFNILVMHRMVTKNGPLWDGQKGNIEAKTLLKQTNFRLIVSGDNHQHFVEEHKMRYLINCGSMIRTNIDQIDHQPVFYVYDTKKLTITKHEIPIKKDVFSFEKYKIDKKGKQDNGLFIRTLTSVRQRKLSFKGNMKDYISRVNLDKEIVDIIDEAMEGI